MRAFAMFFLLLPLLNGCQTKCKSVSLYYIEGASNKTFGPYETYGIFYNSDSLFFSRVNRESLEPSFRSALFLRIDNGRKVYNIDQTNSNLTNSFDSVAIFAEDILAFYLNGDSTLLGINNSRKSNMNILEHAQSLGFIIR